LINRLIFKHYLSDSGKDAAPFFLKTEYPVLPAKELCKKDG